MKIDGKVFFKIFLLLTSGGALLVAFQNCGQVDLSQAQNLPSVNAGISGQFCVSQDATPKFIKTKLYLITLTSLPLNNTLVADTDSDGLSDELEDLPGSLFSSTNRRSHAILDSVCYRMGTNGVCDPAPDSCDSTKSFFYDGVKECDLAAFANTSAPKGLNLDGGSKLDLIPDFIEILRGTSVATEDADADTDQDSQSNEAEIILGSDPTDELSFSPPAVNRAVITSAKDSVAATACNGQDSYSFSISQFPTIPLKAFNDGGPLSHAADENLGLLVLVSRSVATGKIQYYSYLLKVPHDNSGFRLDIFPDDFVFEGEY